MSERRICRVLGQHRSTQRRKPRGRADEERLVADMVELVRQYGRYGYRRIAALLRDAGWQVNDKRIERLWRREGLKVPMKQPKKGRLWLNDGSCLRLRPEYRDHVWSYDFVHHRTDDGKVFRTLNILDEHSRECLAIRVRRKLNSTDIIDALTDLFILRGVPAFIRSDNGPEFVAQAVRDWITVGERLLRKFQCPLQGRTAKWRGILFPEGGTNRHRRMEEARQHQETAQCSGLPPTGPGNHRSDVPKAGHALTFKLDQSVGAGHPLIMPSV